MISSETEASKRHSMDYYQAAHTHEHTHTHKNTHTQVTAAYRLRAWVRWGARYSMNITDDDDEGCRWRNKVNNGERGE